LSSKGRGAGKKNRRTPPRTSATHPKAFLQEVHVENFSQKIDKKIDVSFSSVSGFIAFSGVSQRLELNTLQKTFCKKMCRKAFTKKNDKKSKTDFCRFFFITFFGCFSVRGVKKHHKKILKSDSGPFLTSGPPTHHGGHRLFFFPAPC
jgi:hypothetical protein